MNVFRPAEDIPSVLGLYGMRPLAVRLLSHKGHKAVWLADVGNAGGRIVKKLPYDERNIRFMTAAIDYLRARGIRTPAVSKALNGERWVRVNGENYAVFEAFTGTKPNYRIPDELRAIMRGMASFHKASRGFAPPPGSHPPSRFPEAWEQLRRLQRERLSAWVEEAAKRRNPDEFDKLLAMHGSALLAQCDESLGEHAAVRFERWTAETLRTNTLCHLDFAATNLLLSEAGRLQVIDMDTVAVEVPSVDLRKITNKVMRKFRTWDAEVQLRMLQTYQSVHPLSFNQLQAVAIDILFPHMSYEQIEKYVQRRETGEADRALLAKVQRMIGLDLCKGQELKRLRLRLSEAMEPGRRIRRQA